MNREHSRPHAVRAAPRIGPLELDSPFVQAALSGYSDRPMRLLARRFGASYTVAEVMIERFVVEVKGTGKTAHHLHVGDDEHPVGAQLMGADPKRFPPAARRLVDCGFDVIDINFGCPVKSAIGGCRGGYHLGQPDIAIDIVRRVRDAVPSEIPVTVKMRRGLDDSPGSREQFFTILDGAFAAGIAAITLHGRTVAQKYHGPSDWSFLRAVKQHVGQRTILGSGDLFTPEDCVAMLEQTGVDGVTIARGAIGNPWIFQQACALWAGLPIPDPPDLFEQRQVLREHLELVRETYGAERGFSQLRKFSFKYARLHPQEAEVRQAFHLGRAIADWEQVLDTFYSKNRPGRFPSVDI